MLYTNKLLSRIQSLAVISDPIKNMASKTDSEKYLKKCVLNSDVFAICIQHALSTERQEIMGILIGNVS